MKNDATGTLLTRKSVYPGRTIHLFLERVALPNGAVAELEIVRHPGAACVVPVTDDGHVLMVRQWRHAAGGWLLEAPAGKLDPGEAPRACAARELEEETGHVAGDLIELGFILVSPGFCDERIHLFLARGLTPGTAALEPDEALSVERHAIEDVVSMVAGGAITDSKTIAAISRARLRGLL